MTPEGAEERYGLGLELFRSGNHRLAERTLAEAVGFDPSHHPAHALRALSLCNLGRAADALAAADAALSIRPGLDALRARALALVQLHRSPEAVAAARDAAAIAPANAWAAHTLAVALEDARRRRGPMRHSIGPASASRHLVEAEEQLRRATILEPGNATLRAELGRFLIRRQRLAEAEAVAAGLPPHVASAPALLLHGEIALWRDRSDEARDRALWVLSRDARNRQALTLLTMATANRRPLLKLWWHYQRTITAKPVWQRVLLMAIVLGSGMVLSVLPAAILVYFVLARKQVDREVRRELRAVKLSRQF